ncbi:RNA polymerase sigma factor [Vulgatibacter incomptus]|uniref:RNA polymerase sigma factor RpoE n=1 Tax=Vulgatibacter incomptus TaxID=1391653 RepID=A0A0K1PD02_9BACT|nr:RNA polymerase sigma factor [Vulgatibacter incomptus]AKU91400.1 RNA polymerase sigma factor RpoE [Vulgatibacter incomptus]
MDRETLDEAYRRCFPMIREKCARMLADPDEAQDVAQETFIRLWQNGLAGSDPRTVTAWAYRTSTRLAVDRLRQRKRIANTSLPLEVESPGPDGVLEARWELERLARTTPPRELEAAILQRFDRLGQLEIAGILGASERTVRRLLERFDRRRAEEVGV